MSTITGRQLTVGLIIFMIVALITGCKALRPAPQHTLFTVGDSTVKNGYGDGAGGLWGWGDFLGQFVDTSKIRVANFALGGTSSRTFIDKGLWDSVVPKIRKGDYVLIQFGHNDDGPINDDFRARGTIPGIGEESEEIDNLLTGKHEIVHTYGWYLRKLVGDTKKRGGIPLLVAPIPRNKWVHGKVVRNQNDYGLWAKQVAAQEKVLFIDLNQKMANVMESIGEEQTTGHYYNKKDHTHTSAQGAVLAASLIAGSLQENVAPLKPVIKLSPTILWPKKRNLFLVGDSTMADNQNENAVGWGVPFPSLVDTFRLRVHNKARGGRSSRTFLYEGLWDSIKPSLLPGDFVILQFGHNDAGNIATEKFRGSLPGLTDSVQHIVRPNGEKETVHSFGWYMDRFILDCQKKGAIPLVFSLTPRNEWPNGQVEQRTNTYVAWSKEAAKIRHAVFLDISDSIAKAYEVLGPETVQEFFPKDHTHTGEAGALFSAKVIAKALKLEKKSGLDKYILLPKE